jgi:hypothetical protein
MAALPGIRLVRRALTVLVLFALLGVAVQQTLGARDVSTTSPALVTVCIETEELDGSCGPAQGDPLSETPATEDGGLSYPSGSGEPASGNGSYGSSNPPPAPPPPPPPPPAALASPPRQSAGALVRNDKGQALIFLPNARPGQTLTSCMTITYNGKKPARLRLYGAGSGNGLQSHVRLTVTRGTSTARTPRSCAGFKPDAGNYGSGLGVVFDGLFASFPKRWSQARYDPAGRRTAEIWTTGEKRAYRFSVRVGEDPVIQGLWLTQSFTWEARES